MEYLERNRTEHSQVYCPHEQLYDIDEQEHFAEWPDLRRAFEPAGQGVAYPEVDADADSEERMQYAQANERMGSGAEILSQALLQGFGREHGVAHGRDAAREHKKHHPQHADSKQNLEPGLACPGGRPGVPGIGICGGEREGADEEQGVEQVEGDEEAAGDGDVVAGEAREDGDGADEGFDEEEYGGGDGEGQEAGQVMTEADGFDEQPYSHDEGDTGEGAVGEFHPGGESLVEGEDFALAAGPVTAAAGAGAGGSDEGALEDDDYVDG